jgi:hypothetical protein
MAAGTVAVPGANASGSRGWQPKSSNLLATVPTSQGPPRASVIRLLAAAASATVGGGGVGGAVGRCGVRGSTGASAASAVSATATSEAATAAAGEEGEGQATKQRQEQPRHGRIRGRESCGLEEPGREMGGVEYLNCHQATRPIFPIKKDRQYKERLSDEQTGGFGLSCGGRYGAVCIGCMAWSRRDGTKPLEGTAS